MNRWLCAILLFGCFIFSALAQRSALRVMEYNVENLFDTLHAVGHRDADFTPQGSYKWGSGRYWAKLTRLSKVIAAAGGVQPVDLVALVEVENDSVVYDLTRRTKLWRLGYDYVMSHSADVRGINVALLYLPHRFRVLMKDSVRVMPSSPKQLPTRDVLHVAGELVTGDTLDVFVCHFPSRRGGSLAERYRSLVAQGVRSAVDSVVALRTRPYVLITGDFNGFYPERFMTNDLGAQLIDEADTLSAMTQSQLYLLTYKMQGRGDVCGTYKFQGEWNQLDHFLVNSAFFRSSAQLRVFKHDCKILDFPFLLQNDKSQKGGVHPFRTFLGTYYQGGYSDHLPILLDIHL